MRTDFFSSLKHGKPGKIGRWANLHIAALGGLIILGSAFGANAEMAPGTYVSPGLGVVLQIEQCASAELCGEVVHGKAPVAKAVDATHMMPPYRGKGWRYLALRGKDGQQAGWMRQLGSQRTEILRCKSEGCERMAWQKVGPVSDDLSAMANFSGAMK